MLAFFTPFIARKIQYSYGYVFAGCNLAAFAVVYLFMLESNGKTLEEVDGMYLLEVPPRQSAKFTFDEGTKARLAEILHTDAMDLKTKDGKTVKRGEANVGDALHREEAANGDRPSSGTSP